MATQILENTNDSPKQEEIPSLLVPLANSKLLLPTVSIAEMLPYREPQIPPTLAADSLPNWYLGDVLWRGVNVPMFSFEGINGGDIPTIRAVSQMTVLNNTGVCPAKLPFLCFPTEGIPRLHRVVATEITEDRAVDCRPYDKMRIMIAGESAVIPDVAKLEDALVELLALK